MKCGCYIYRQLSKSQWKIVFCPLHAAAEEMLKFIRRASYYDRDSLAQAEKIAAKAGGRHE